MGWGRCFKVTLQTRVPENFQHIILHWAISYNLPNQELPVQAQLVHHKPEGLQHRHPATKCHNKVCVGIWYELIEIIEHIAYICFNLHKCKPLWFVLFTYWTLSNSLPTTKKKVWSMIQPWATLSILITLWLVLTWQLHYIRRAIDGKLAFKFRFYSLHTTHNTSK